VNGFARNGRIANLKGATSDDLVALNADEGGFVCDNCDMENITIDGIYAGRNGYTTVRLLSRTAKLTSIVIRNVFGSYSTNAVSFTHWAKEPGDYGWFDGVVLDGICASSSRKSQFLPDADLSPAARAYVRARGGDRMSSFGDVVGVSDVLDASLATVLRREVSDLIIAPGYEPDALAMLKEKKKGNYLVFEIDPDYQSPELETRELFGFSLRQKRNDVVVSADHFRNVVTEAKAIPDDVLETLMVATVALKYTQSNSVCLAYDGQVIGMGAGQQSRVHCTRLACGKADKWFLQQHPKTLALQFRDGLKRPDKANIVDQFVLWDELSERERKTLLQGLGSCPDPITTAERVEWINRFAGVCLSSDAYIPFRDNIDRASRSNVQYVAQAGSSLRDDQVTEAADE